MNSRLIFPKYIYYIGLIIQIALNLILSNEVIERALNSDKIPLFIFLGFNTFTFLIFYFYLTKWIYISVNIEKNDILLGNLFFRKKKNLEDAVKIQKVWWLNAGYRIRIDNRYYYFVSIDKNVKEYFQ